MRITRQAVTASQTCAICDRTLLVGERPVRYSPDGENFVDVCPLCQETAVDYGWLKEGSPTSPVVSEPELAMVEAADLFNESAFRRTVAGIAKSLGAPKASILPLSGVNSEVVLTVAWDISWYQYRITPDSGQPVRLAERGHEPGELESLFTGWNAHLSPDGRIVPEISPV